MKLFPNPANDYFDVEFNEDLQLEYSYRLFDAVGRVVSTGRVEQGKRIHRIRTDELASGMYIFAIENQNIYAQQKIIIAKP